MNAIPLAQITLFGAEALFAAVLLLALFRLRRFFGLAPLYVTLGVFQPIQVFLAASVYVEFYPGVTISPGSSVMFTASLFAILLIYIREDALEARKIIYGILIANLAMTCLLLVFGYQLGFSGTLNFLQLPQTLFNQGARVMLAGTLALFIDVLLIIFIFEAARRLLPKSVFLRIYLTMVITLSLDTLIFASGAFWGQPNYSGILLSGIVGKSSVAILYSVALYFYLRYLGKADAFLSAESRNFQDIFSTLTYRDKYQMAQDRTEEVEREGQDRFRAIFDAANDALFIHELETGALLDVNQTMCRMYELSYEDALRSDVGSLSSGVFPYTHNEAVHWVRKAAEGTPQLFEWQAKTKTGRVFWVEVNMRRASVGAEERIVVSARDITERKYTEVELAKHRDHLEALVEGRTAELETKTRDLERSAQAMQYLLEDVNETNESLRVANDKLQQLDKLKSMFIASMSHELRTPLNSVLGYSSILLNEWIGPLNKEQKKSQASILRSGQHLLSLITDVIDVSKIEAGMLAVDIRCFDLEEIFTELEMTFLAQAQEKGLSLVIQRQSLALCTDRRRLLQCLLNLVGNAIKYTEEGEVRVSLHNDLIRGLISIEIKDTGIGIAEENLPLLFQAFSRIPSEKTISILGTGLGLYLTKKIAVEILAGDVTVTSILGHGSTFTLTVPCQIDGEPEEKKESRRISHEDSFSDRG